MKFECNDCFNGSGGVTVAALLVIVLILLFVVYGPLAGSGPALLPAWTSPTPHPLIRPGDGAERKERMGKFSLGQVLATPGVLEAAGGESLVPYLARHARCDWGTVGPADWRANDRALVDGTRLLSAYLLKSGVKVWVITEADRSATTVLLPDEY